MSPESAPHTAAPAAEEPRETSAAPAPRRRKSLRARIGLALGATLGALLVAELCVRLLGLAPPLRSVRLSGEDSPYRRSENPILGYEHKVSYRNDHPDYVVSFGSTNAHGQRDIERQIAKPAGVRRIILLGDSVVESLEVARLDDLMNRQLEKLYADGRTEVLNFGVNGYCTRAEVELLRTKGLKFQPDLVVLVFVGNDYLNMNNSAGGVVAGLAALEQGSAPSWLSARLAEHSHLYRAVCARLARRGPEADPLLCNQQALGENNVVQGLELLRQLADEHGFEVLVAIWPTFTDDGIIDDVTEGAGELLIERLAAMYGLPSVRLSEGFRRHWKQLAAQGTPQSYYTIGDGMHVNEAGSRAAAEVFKQAIDAFDTAGTGRSPAPRPPLDMAAVRAAQFVGAGAGGYSLTAGLADVARCQLDAGHEEEAIRYYQLALQQDPDAAYIHAELGLLYRKRGEERLAREQLDRARELGLDVEE